jgi:C1A family cysteine protease
MERRYGWIPQKPDDRDWKYPTYAKPLEGFPPSVDLRENMPPIYDQGQLGSCTAHGIARAFQYAEIKAKFPSVMPSRLFLYYNERLQEGTIPEDAGAIIRDGLKACNIYGVVDEEKWPYDDGPDQFKVKPPEDAYASAKETRIKFYASVDNTDLNHVKLCMVHGWPIVFGFQVYKEFENYKSGVLQVPSEGERCLGGHCVCAAGYDDEKQAILVANSWGDSFGVDGGYFWISYEYFTSNLVSDCWMMRLK